MTTSDVRGQQLENFLSDAGEQAARMEKKGGKITFQLFP